MMYIDNEVLEKMIMTIVEGFDRIEKKLDRMGRVKDCLNGDELLDNYDIQTAKRIIADSRPLQGKRADPLLPDGR